MLCLFGERSDVTFKAFCNYIELYFNSRQILSNLLDSSLSSESVHKYTFNSTKNRTVAQFSAQVSLDMLHHYFTGIQKCIFLDILLYSRFKCKVCFCATLDSNSEKNVKYIC